MAEGNVAGREAGIGPGAGYALRPVGVEDVWRWVGAGWTDFRRAMPFSLAYGAVFTGVGVALVAGLFASGLSAVVPVAAGAFALVGPLVAVGLYEISRRLEAGEPLAWRPILLVRTAAPDQIALIGVALLLLLMVWARAAQLLFALFSHEDYVVLSQFASWVLTDRDGLLMLVIGTVIGAGIGLFVFAISALSLPLLMHRDVDVATAIGLSLTAMRRYPRAMLLWAWIIAAATAAGLAAGLVGLCIVFPMIGHATWHAYRHMIVSPGEARG
ncbi:MAG: DUF2189 domain-containing protein [Alphaproteobacteria bacterium]|nr:DUF2189 domain-containing protein [Alphaproteobacteria bacterium]